MISSTHVILGQFYRGVPNQAELHFPLNLVQIVLKVCTYACTTSYMYLNLVVFFNLW